MVRITGRMCFLCLVFAAKALIGAFEELPTEVDQQGVTNQQVGQQMKPGAAKEASEDKSITVDFLTGKELLGEEEAAKHALVIRANEGIVTFNAKIEGPTPPIKLDFLEAEKCPAKSAHNASDNGIFFTLRVCKIKHERGKCEKGAAVCYPGRLDPRNRNVDYHVALPNAKTAALPNVCEGAKWSWPIWMLKTMHTLMFSSIGDGIIKVQASFLDERIGSEHKEGRNSVEMRLGKDGCIVFWAGHPEDGLFGRITNDRGDVIRQNLTQFMEERSNGAPLHSMWLTSSLPPDLFVGTKSGDPMLAFVGSRGCDLSIQIDGLLKRCQVPGESPLKSEEEKMLNKWIKTGTGQLQSVSLIHMENRVNQAHQFWEIDGLTAKLTKSKKKSKKQQNSTKPFAWSTVFAEKSFSLMAVNPCKRSLYYYEVKVKKVKGDWMRVGLSGPTFPIEGKEAIGNVVGSFAVDAKGTLWRSGTEFEFEQKEGGSGEGFGKGDVIGCGLLILPADKHFIFFTRNGQLLGKFPVSLPTAEVKDHLYPAISAMHKGDMVELNFGAKPFLYVLSHLKVTNF